MWKELRAASSVVASVEAQVASGKRYLRVKASSHLEHAAPTRIGEYEPSTLIITHLRRLPQLGEFGVGSCNCLDAP